MKERIWNDISQGYLTGPAILMVAPAPQGRKKTKNANGTLRSPNENWRNVSFVLALLGVLVFGFWLYTNDGSTTSTLLLLAGITLLSIAIMLYYFTPARYVREEISDAMAISSLISLNRVLSSSLVEPRGIYVPSDEKGIVKLFLPLANADQADKGLTLQPPGFGLYVQARSIGAAFTTEGLDHQIKDVLVNGLELAGSVSIKPWGNLYVVEMHYLMNADLCRRVREENPAICTKTGCPICSSIACMIAEGTGRKVWIGSVRVEGEKITTTYEVI